MPGDARTVILTLFAPPVLLLLWAHLLRPTWPNSEIVALMLVGFVGLGGIAISGRRDRTKLVVATAYTLIGLFALPYLMLIAVCTTGDCL